MLYIVEPFCKNGLLMNIHATIRLSSFRLKIILFCGCGVMHFLVRTTVPLGIWTYILQTSDDHVEPPPLWQDLTNP
jgi:hypothetical protein